MTNNATLHVSNNEVTDSIGVLSWLQPQEVLPSRLYVASLCLLFSFPLAALTCQLIHIFYDRFHIYRSWNSQS